MIYCVEDDSSIRDLMIYTLNSAGFEAMGFEDGKSLYEGLKETVPRLILLDIMLPDEDGISILKCLKADSATAKVPVIMATAKGTEYDKVLGLDLGADDYLAKPFGMMEMVSRVRAVLRRCPRQDTADVLRFEDLQMNISGHTVTAAGQDVKLALKEFEILRTLMESPGVVFSREKLLRNVWGQDFMGESRTIDVHINTLRTKIGSCGSYIKTVRGVGYRIDAR